MNSITLDWINNIDGTLPLLKSIRLEQQNVCTAVIVSLKTPTGVGRDDGAGVGKEGVAVCKGFGIGDVESHAFETAGCVESSEDVFWYQYS
jgi:hypothetical protein